MFAAQPASRKYANSFPTNYNVNYARIAPSASQSSFRALANSDGFNLEKDIHHKGFLVFVVRDWGHITQGSALNHDVRNSNHVSDVVSLAGLNAILYNQATRKNNTITPQNVINAVNFDGVIRTQAGEEVEDVLMNPVESGLAQASVFNITVRGRVPTQNVWGQNVKGNQMLYLVIKTCKRDDEKDLVVRGYRTDPNGLATGKLAGNSNTVDEFVQVKPWIAPDGSDRPPNSMEVGKGGYYISVGRCSDRKKYAKSNEMTSQFGYFDARCAITAPLVELHVETCSPPITYARQGKNSGATITDDILKMVMPDTN